MQDVTIDMLINGVMADELSVAEFLECWNRLPYGVFCDAIARTKVRLLSDIAAQGTPLLTKRVDFTDPFLPQERLNHILREVSQSRCTAFLQLLIDLKRLKGFSFSMHFRHRVIDLLMYLIQFEHYKLATDLLRIAPEYGILEDIVDETRDCIYTYAVRMVTDDQELIRILDTFQADAVDKLFFIRCSPFAAAAAAGKKRIIEHLHALQLCEQE